MDTVDRKGGVGFGGRVVGIKIFQSGTGMGNRKYLFWCWLPF